MSDEPHTGPRLTRKDLMTARQVADLLDVPVSTVRGWGRDGTLPGIKLGRHVRFIRAQVEATVLGAVQNPARPPRSPSRPLH